MKWNCFVICSLVWLSSLAQADYDPPPWESVEVIPKAPKRSVKNSKNVKVQYSGIEKVTVYVKSFCRECDAVVNLLKERGVKYEKVYSYLTLTGIPGVLLDNEEPPITVVEYTNGTSRKIVGYDETILNVTFERREPGLTDDFNISEFDLRGTDKSNPPDSFDLR